ncbi:hypothetical protein [Halosegnis marinus]|uniref:Uncharacterized protein n=1 Tax=Halosegnis marinus TaxID=3034023 RepID=A0ABD5ZJR1_9EURY|nr:hypothetical protein [Halosegnis sp. DT85]
MAGALDIVYSVAMLGLAVAGTAYVFFGTTDRTGTETTLSNASLVVATALFLAVMVWSVV